MAWEVPRGRSRRVPSKPEEVGVDLGLAGARALVGGGSGGLGGAIGAALSAEGARVALVARPSERLDAAAAGIPGALAIGADLATPDGPASAVERTVARLGGL